MFSEEQIKKLALEKVESTDNLKIFEDIVDKQGHKRFIEGDITIETITGVTQKYGKWSVSGTHLMIVLAVDVENGVSFTSGSTIATITNIPQWVLDKIFPISGTVVVPYIDFSGQGQNWGVRLEKNSSDKLQLKAYSITMNQDRSFRIAFDLLIDNAQA